MDLKGRTSGVGIDAADTAAAVLACAAAWVAAGSTGLLGHALRHVLTVILLFAVAVLGRPRALCRRGTLWVAGSLLLAALLTASRTATVNVMAVPLVAAALAATHRGALSRLWRVTAFAVAGFAIYRFACSASPALWLAGQSLSTTLSRVAGAVAGQPLNAGASPAGLDFVVLSVFWYGAWIALAGARTAAGVSAAALAIPLVHALYLVSLAWAPALLRALPEPAAQTTGPLWLSALRHAIPWNWPILAALGHGILIACMARWTPWPADEEDVPATDAGRPPARWVRCPWIRAVAAAVTAAGLGLCGTLCVRPASLDGRTVVFYEEGFLNWLKPKHDDYGRLSIGMYGLLPPFLQSLGARCIVSPDLSAKDVDSADVLVLIYPDKPWTKEQLDRIARFVERGGSLWVLGEHTVREPDGDTRFNEALRPTRMRVQFDSATYAIGGWLQSYEALAHPATLGIGDDRNEFGIVIGASLDVRWPAMPLIAGRWGWSDWGDPGGNAMMGNGRYDPGERLGDVVLAAEQRVGKGRVLAFGDTSSLSNGINMGSYPFTARVFAYLANAAQGPHWGFRGWATPVLSCLLALLLAWRINPRAVAAATLALAAAVALATAHTGRTLTLLPHRAKTPDYKIACIDAAHLGLYSPESWRDDGLMGLSLNLMRNGYLTLAMPDFRREQLEQADLLVCVAPGRPYSRRECEAVRSFVERGGLFILTVGYDERIPAQPLLDAFGFQVGDGTTAQGMGTGPIPLGHFKSPYYDGGKYMAHVRFHAAWHIACRFPDARPLAYGRGNIPVAMVRRVGKGKVVVVGDTCFAMNKNLEVESGQPFEGMRENPHFWRWLLSYLQDRPPWVPPDPAAGQPETPPANN